MASDVTATSVPLLPVREAEEFGLCVALRSQWGVRDVNLPGCCCRVPPPLLLLKEYKVSIVRVLYRMTDLTHGTCARWMPSLSAWDLSTTPVPVSAPKHHAMTVRPAQLLERTFCRREPLNSPVESPDGAKLPVGKPNASKHLVKGKKGNQQMVGLMARP